MPAQAELDEWPPHDDYDIGSDLDCTFSWELKMTDKTHGEDEPDDGSNAHPRYLEQRATLDMIGAFPDPAALFWFDALSVTQKATGSSEGNSKQPELVASEQLSKALLAKAVELRRAASLEKIVREGVGADIEAWASFPSNYRFAGGGETAVLVNNLTSSPPADDMQNGLDEFSSELKQAADNIAAMADELNAFMQASDAKLQLRLAAMRAEMFGSN